MTRFRFYRILAYLIKNKEMNFMEMHDNTETVQRALLVGIDTGEYDAEGSMDELFELVKSAGAEPVAAVMQKRDKPDGATCVGSGRIEEIKIVLDYLFT